MFPATARITAQAGAGTRNIEPARKATLCDDHHIVLARFADSLRSSSSGSCLLRGNGGGHAESDQNHNRHCDDELACSGILASKRNGRRQKAAYGIMSNSYLPIQGLQPVY
jgi:hypothetical protein